MCDRVGVLYAGAHGRGGHGRARCSTIRGIPTPWACCAASRAAACARTTAGSTPSRASCRRSAPTCPAASSPTAARSPRTAAAPTSRRAFEVGGDHISRCYYHERAQQLPRAMAANLEGAGVVDRTRPSRCSRSTTSPRPSASTATSVHAARRRLDVIWPGETLGLVGESGSGKTTFARTLLGIVAPDARAASSSTAASSRRRSRGAPREDVRALQIVFQNPDSALNRRHTVRRILRRSLQAPRRPHRQGRGRAHPRAERGRAPARPRHPAARRRSSRAG